MPFDLNAAHQALGLDIPPATPQRPAVPWRSPGGPVLTHDAIARRVAELDRIANLDQMPTGQRALEFLKGLNPLAGFDFNAPRPEMPAGFRAQPAAPTQEQQADPLAQYRQLAGMIPAIAQAAPEVLENFTLALANRDPHAVGLLAQTVGTLPLGMTEMGPKVEQAGTALARVAETAPANAFVNEAHAALGLPPIRQPLALPAPAERKLLTAGQVDASPQRVGEAYDQYRARVKGTLPLEQQVGESYDDYHLRMRLSQSGRIEPSPGALANKDTQPFETLQLKKPLGEHTAEELDALQSKVQSAHARAQKAIESGAIGTTKPAEYDLQVLADERARRSPKAFASSLSEIQKNGGITLDPRTAQPTEATGFAVADPAFTLLVKPGDDAKMAAWLESPEVKQRLQQPGAHLGAWRDPSNGRLEVNISDIIPDRQMALSMGALRNQKAIGSLVKGAYAGDVEVLPKFRPKPSEIEAYTPPDRRVYHGTSNPANFGIPTRTTDIGTHVGTAGQAESIMTGGAADGPPWSIDDYPRGARILPLDLRGDAKLAKISRDLADWNPHETAAQLLNDKIITKDEAKDLLKNFVVHEEADLKSSRPFTTKEQYDHNIGLVRDLLEKKGYAGIEYPNRYEASGWDITAPPHGPRPEYAPSQILFRPTRDLKNPLLSPEGLAADRAADRARQGIPPVIAGEPTPKGLLAENLKRYPPSGEPTQWIGGSPPAGPPKTGLPEEHVRGLAMNAASDKQYNNESVTSFVKRVYPHYAPYLDAKSTAKIEQLAKKFRNITRNFTPLEDSKKFGDVVRPSIGSLFGSDAGYAIRKWYEGWKGAVGDALPPDAAEMLTRFSSILSAQASPKDEVGMALAALDRWAHGETLVTNEYKATTPERMKQLALASKDQRWGKKALKTSGYYLARKGFKQTGALDRHVIRAYMGTDKVTPAQYEALWHRVNADAEKLGVPFDEMQAGVWGGQTGYKAGPGEPGAAPEDWLAQHLASGNFDRLIEKYPGLEKLRAKGEQALERQGMSDSGLLGDVNF